MSVCGPASGADPQWLAQVIESTEQYVAPTILLGDFNWRSVYEEVTLGNWALSAEVPSVTGSLASPTRLIGTIDRQHLSNPISLSCAGVPHHLATQWTIQCRMPVDQCQPKQRIAKCASYLPLAKPSGDDLTELHMVVNQYRSRSCGLDAWRSCFEALLEIAMARGVLVITQHAEHGEPTKF